MRIKFYEDDLATEQDAVNVMVKDIKIRTRIKDLKDELVILNKYQIKKGLINPLYNSLD